MKKIILMTLSLIVLGFLGFEWAEAVSVSIDTEKETYHYGDYLTFTITVDEVTGSFATLFVVDESGKRSSPIVLPVTNPITVQTAPFPFEKLTYPEGKWALEVEYGGVTDIAEFFVKDSGQIVIPIWIKDVGRMYANDSISAEQYVTSIEFLIAEKIIKIPDYEKQNTEKKIPEWIRTTTDWWTQGMISDHEYATSLEFLIKKEIIVV